MSGKNNLTFAGVFMSRHISKFLILLSLIWIQMVQNVSAFSGDEKKKPKSAQTKKGERVIITIRTEIIEDEICDCASSSAPIYNYSRLEIITRTIYKPFRFAGKLFKPKN